MRTKSFAVGLVLVLALSVAGVQAWAQKVKANIPFDFVAGEQEFPAGNYQIKFETGLQKHLILKSLDDSDLSANVMYITRLSEREGGEPCLIFDKDGDKAYLSEVYMVGMDGFHLQGAPGKHTHQKVAGGK